MRIHIERKIGEKIRKRGSLFSVLVLAGMMLAGCGKEDAASSQEGTDSAEGSELALIGAEVVSVEEAQKTVLMKIENEEITLDDLNLYYIQYLYNNRTGSDALTEDKIQQIQATVVDEIMMETAEYIVAQNTEGVEVSKEKEEEATASAARFFDHFGKDFLGNYGIDAECVNDLFTRQAYITALTDKAVADMSETYLPQLEEEYADLTFHCITYALFPSIQYDADGNPVRNDDGSYVSLSEDELAGQLEKAEELRQRAIAGAQSGDETATLEALIKEYGIAHCSGVERNFEGAYTEQLNNAIKDLKDGEFSQVIKTDAGYMVARMDKVNDEEYKDYNLRYLANQSAKNSITKMQEKWAEQAKLDQVEVDKEVLDRIDLKQLSSYMEQSNLFE